MKAQGRIFVWDRAACRLGAAEEAYPALQDSQVGLRRRWPAHGWVGLGMVAVFWPLNWFLPGLRTHLLFFPLWLGYCLAVDALVVLRKGDSLLTRSPHRYVGLFLVSVPAWWLFEALNIHTGNWVYQGAKYFTPAQFAILASISFSTVIPAVFGTAELASTFGWLRHTKPGPRIPKSGTVLLGFFVVGWLMLALLIIWPRLFFPFIWLGPYFVLEPINVWMGHRSLATTVDRRDWRPVLALWVGVLICGFFWEFWNFYSYPKWIYHVPYLGFLHVFEMPLLGYGGYLPFSLELFAIYQFVAGLIRRNPERTYVHLVSEAGSQQA